MPQAIYTSPQDEFTARFLGVSNNLRGQVDYDPDAKTRFTAELRYLVLPERPDNTDTLTETELAALVTLDAMIGVAKVAGKRDESAA